MEQSAKLVSANSDEGAEIVAKYAMPVGVKRRDADKPWDGGVNRATFALIQAGRKHVFVTCHHVLQDLLKRQEQDPSARLVAYSGREHFGRIVPAEYNTFQLVDESKRIDVAVFCGLTDIISYNDLPDREFIPYTESYLQDPKEGDPVMIVGYPAATVSVTHQVMDLGYTAIGYTASHVSERNIVLANDRGGRTFTDYDDSRRQGISLGGLSGSPAFVIRDRQLRFVGIVSESTDYRTTADTIIIARLGCLNPDGTLDHLKIPW
jgi:Trypsin-like peptidase domain